MGGRDHTGTAAVLVGGAIYLILAAIVLGVLYFILGSVIEVGYARFNLNLTAGEKPPFETLFSCFPNWKTVAMARLLQTVYILLWTLLLVIPGIVAGYSYAMTDYILAEHPELTASEAIAQSKAMMAGNRWRLFCLQFSFIGWSILCTLTLGLATWPCGLMRWPLSPRFTGSCAAVRCPKTRNTPHKYCHPLKTT